MGDAMAAVTEAGASIQAATKALTIANSQGQVAAQLVEAAAQQVGPDEAGKGAHIDEHA